MPTDLGSAGRGASANSVPAQVIETAGRQVAVTFSLAMRPALCRIGIAAFLAITLPSN